MALEDIGDILHAGVINSDNWDSNVPFLLWIFLHDRLARPNKRGLTFLARMMIFAPSLALRASTSALPRFPDPPAIATTTMIDAGRICQL